MRFHGWLAGAVAAFALVLGLDSSIPGGDKKSPVAIKFVMQKAHKGNNSLLSKVSSGKASAEEKKLLIALYTDLAANKNPKGDDNDWKERTQALLKAAQADDSKALRKAADCVGCHSEHK